MTVSDAPPIVSTRFGLADGHTLEGYLATGGYEGLKAALSKAPTAVGDEVKAASLLGRGGAGFPAGTKWGFCPPGVWPRYLVVNGDESEPGTYKDRLLMEKDPHQLIEGVLIACYAIGAAQAFLYVRGEMALARTSWGRRRPSSSRSKATGACLASSLRSSLPPRASTCSPRS